MLIFGTLMFCVIKELSIKSLFHKTLFNSQLNGVTQEQKIVWVRSLAFNTDFSKENDCTNPQIDQYATINGKPQKIGVAFIQQIPGYVLAKRKHVKPESSDVSDFFVTECQFEKKVP